MSLSPRIGQALLMDGSSPLLRETSCSVLDPSFVGSFPKKQVGRTHVVGSTVAVLSRGCPRTSLAQDALQRHQGAAAESAGKDCVQETLNFPRGGGLPTHSCCPDRPPGQGPNQTSTRGSAGSLLGRVPVSPPSPLTLPLSQRAAEPPLQSEAFPLARQRLQQPPGLLGGAGGTDKKGCFVHPGPVQTGQQHQLLTPLGFPLHTGWGLRRGSSQGLGISRREGGRPSCFSAFSLMQHTCVGCEGDLRQRPTARLTILPGHSQLLKRLSHVFPGAIPPPVRCLLWYCGGQSFIGLP